MQNQSADHLSQESVLKRRALAVALQALVDPTLTLLKADDLSRTVLQCLREMMAADNLAILLLTEDHAALHIHTVLGLEETVAGDVYIPLGRGFAGQIATQGLPLIVHDTSTLEIMTPVLREQLHSLLGVPLIVHKQMIGVIHVGMKREYLFTDADVALMQHVADYLAQAFERTLLIEAEQHEFEELIEAQLCAVVELVEAQQHAAEGLVEAQQRVAIELVEEQQHIRIKALERMNELETIFNAIIDGVIVYNDQEYIIHSNRAANHFLGIETHPAELNNPSHSSWRTTYQLNDAHGYPFSHEHLPLKRLLSGERLVAKQAVMVHLHTLDDRDVQLSVTGSPLYDQRGHLYGAVCVLRDVTTRKYMERRVEILEVLLQMVQLLVKSSAQKDQMGIQDDHALAIQQIESNILVLAQRLLNCSHAVIIGIQQNSHILFPLALAGYSSEQEQRLRSDLTGAQLSFLLNDPNKVALLEKQESLPFLITQSPLLPSLSDEFFPKLLPGANPCHPSSHRFAQYRIP